MRRLLMLPLAATLLLAACDGPAEFSAPLGPPGTAPYDERLVGAWYALQSGDDEDAVSVLVVKPGAEDGYLDGAFGYMEVQPGPGPVGGAGIVSFNRSAYATVIDGQTYFNTRLIDGMMVSKEAGGELGIAAEAMFAPHPELGYWIMRATIQPDDVLRLDVVTENAPAAAGYEAREVDCGDDCDFKVFDLTPEQMADLIRTTPPENLFRIRMAFARFGSPSPPQPD